MSTSIFFFQLCIHLCSYVTVMSMKIEPIICIGCVMRGTVSFQKEGTYFCFFLGIQLVINFLLDYQIQPIKLVLKLCSYTKFKIWWKSFTRNPVGCSCSIAHKYNALQSNPMIFLSVYSPFGIFVSSLL